MRITTKGRYALSAVVALACLTNEDDPVSVRTLAVNEGLSADFLEQIFFRLRRSGIVTSVRGPGGGFRLARPPCEISLHEILDAAGEPIDLADPDPSATKGAAKPRPAASRKARSEVGTAADYPLGIGKRKSALALRELEDELRRFASGKSLADIVGSKRA